MNDKAIDQSGIIAECQRLRISIQQLNDRVRGPLSKSSQKNTALPFVFLLGNHSSGKSSFINYLLKRDIQTTGVAPTDDNFTVIMPGKHDVDRDGTALISDPDLGFSGLQQFGPSLIHHTQLKIRSNIAIQNFMILDSPGMIDSPKVKDPFGSGQYADVGRGYDFERVVTWYAEHADVILLFFDPDKPGTTGETLSILTNSLIGMDNKVYIILNKADQFLKIHDFARAYGSLCWNLSKVLQRKDLPRIYTMCLPNLTSENDKNNRKNIKDIIKNTSSTTSSTSSSSLLHGIGLGLADLESTREDVIREVVNAPKRRIDNELNRLTASVQLLKVYCDLVKDVTSIYYKSVWNARILLSSVSSLVTATGVIIINHVSKNNTSTASSTSILNPVGMLRNIPKLHSKLQFRIFLGVSLSVLSYYLLYKWQIYRLNQLAQQLISTKNMQVSFNRIYSRQLQSMDIYQSSLWQKLSQHFANGTMITPSDLPMMSNISKTELQLLDTILEKDLPSLRRIAAPFLNSFPSIVSKSLMEEEL